MTKPSPRARCGREMLQRFPRCLINDQDARPCRAAVMNGQFRPIQRNRLDLGALGQRERAHAQARRRMERRPCDSFREGLLSGLCRPLRGEIDDPGRNRDEPRHEQNAEKHDDERQRALELQPRRIGVCRRFLALSLGLGFELALLGCHDPLDILV